MARAYSPARPARPAPAGSAWPTCDRWTRCGHPSRSVSTRGSRARTAHPWGPCGARSHRGCPTTAAPRPEWPALA
eukprot:11189183-Lingulodinium_polyedra.AAC.1